MSRVRYVQAANQVLREMMAADDRFIYLGEDVRRAVRGVARGLHEEFGDQRVVDAPISEQAFTGAATGMAMAGLRPIIEYQITALLYVAYDQLIDQAQKLSFITGGQTSVPVTYLIAGSGWRLGIAGQHADNPYAILVHGGMKTAIPMTSYDIAGVLRAALQDPDPVAVFLPATALARRGEVPDDPFVVEAGTGDVVREGSDVTLVAIGALVPVAVSVAETLAAEGIGVEVIDPRWLLPFDWTLLEASVQKTGRLVICDDAGRTCGMAADVAATMSERCAAVLRAPIVRITRPDVPSPFAATLEAAVIPGSPQVEAAVRRAMVTARAGAV